MAESGPLTQSGGHKRKKYTRRACLPCIRSKRSCSETRPCERCVNLGRASECVDGARKKKVEDPDAEPRPVSDRPDPTATLIVRNPMPSDCPTLQLPRWKFLAEGLVYGVFAPFTVTPLFEERYRLFCSLTAGLSFRKLPPPANAEVEWDTYFCTVLSHSPLPCTYVAVNPHTLNWEFVYLNEKALALWGQTRQTVVDQLTTQHFEWPSPPEEYVRVMIRDAEMIRARKELCMDRTILRDRAGNLFEVVERVKIEYASSGCPLSVMRIYDPHTIVPLPANAILPSMKRPMRPPSDTSGPSGQDSAPESGESVPPSPERKEPDSSTGRDPPALRLADPFLSQPSSSSSGSRTPSAASGGTIRTLAVPLAQAGTGGVPGLPRLATWTSAFPSQLSGQHPGPHAGQLSALPVHMGGPLSGPMSGSLAGSMAPSRLVPPPPLPGVHMLHVDSPAGSPSQAQAQARAHAHAQAQAQAQQTAAALLSAQQYNAQLAALHAQAAYLAPRGLGLGALPPYPPVAMPGPPYAGLGPPAAVLPNARLFNPAGSIDPSLGALHAHIASLSSAGALPPPAARQPPNPDPASRDPQGWDGPP